MAYYEPNVCKTCGAGDGRAGVLINGECLNCRDTRKTGEVVVHVNLSRTEAELAKTFAILNETLDLNVMTVTFPREIECLTMTYSIPLLETVVRRLKLTDNKFGLTHGYLCNKIARMDETVRAEYDGASGLIVEVIDGMQGDGLFSDIEDIVNEHLKIY